MFKPFQNQAKALSRYWNLYGGVKSLVLSPYFIAASLLSSFCFKGWSARSIESKPVIADIILSVLPNLLGFSIGALAIVLATSSSELFQRLAENGRKNSFFIILTANLTHFIIVQVVALIAAIVVKLAQPPHSDFVLVFLLIYAVMVAMAAGIQLFLTADLYNASAALKSRSVVLDELRAIKRVIESKRRTVESKKSATRRPVRRVRNGR